MILTNGCSFTEGYDLGNAELAWPYQLANMLNQSCKNVALGGSSNTRIARTLREHLIKEKPNLVVVGWTDFSRSELSHKEGMYVRAMSTGCLAESEYQPSDLGDLHKNWALYNYNSWINYRNWIYDVLDLQSHLSALNIPFKFFTAFGNNYIYEFLNDTDKALALADLSWQWRDRRQYDPERTIHSEWQELFQLVKQIDLTTWVDCGHETMSSYLEKNKYATDSTGHYLADGHRAWAEHITKEIL